MQVAILGRQAKISLAELECLFGATAIKPIGHEVALIDSPQALPQTRLGGTLKSAHVLHQFKNANETTVFEYLHQNLDIIFGDLTDGKIKLGFSVYGFDIKREKLLKHTLTLKKAIKKAGRSVRIVENKSATLSSAQVLYNKLTDDLSREFLIIKNNSDVILAQTTAVQDIDAYGKRDFGRPKRDARVGMLPPKLAQIITNLAVQDTTPDQSSIVLDPFCGTGVVLQEASLMGFKVYGSDLEPRMIEYSKANLDWLSTLPDNKTVQLSNDDYRLEIADATDHTWQPTPQFIACETYLGRPFSTLPTPDVLQKVIQDVNTIHEKFLQNVARQTEKGFRMCIALPTWNTPHGFWHLKVLDSLEELGYTRLVFEHASNQELIYHRPDQIVARELVVLRRK